jgi:RNA 2',3'-cyclic 3'-phosphodiesterase
MESEVRCFFALWPEQDLGHELYALGAAIVGRRMREETLHLTLAFLGNVESRRIGELCHLAANLSLPALDLTIDRLGCWEHSGVCWAGPTGLPAPFLAFIDTLHAQLRAAGFALEEREFAAHISLLRNVGKDSVRSRAVCSPLASSLVWPLQAWRLVASLPDGAGRRYEILGEWPALRCDPHSPALDD